MNKTYDAVVFIGRFQPFHNAHLEILRRASAVTEKVIMVLGSANMPASYKNPFTVKQRAEMISAAIADAHGGWSNNMHFEITWVEDSIYNDQAWAASIQEEVAKYADKNVAIIGHKKDETSFYLDMFPQWELIEIPQLEPLDATLIREVFFSDMNINLIRGVVPAVVFEYLCEFKESTVYQQLVREREFIANYKKQYASLPFPPVFVTTDAVTIQSGHVLLIKRRAEPGKGLWALPGGFLDTVNDRSMVDAAIRELKEETGIKVPVPVLKGSITDNKVFDAIGRSARGRTITHAFKIVLPDGPLPKVKGQDDAEKAKWVPIADLRRDQMFEDHWDIIKNFLGA